MSKHIGIVYPAGKIKLTDQQKHEKIQRLESFGFKVTDIKPELSSLDGCTSAPVLERATQLAYALTARKFDVVMAARGGVGSTELIPFLENILPPVISDKTFVGFSDNSFLGCYLALRFPNLRYIHGQMAFPSDGKNESERDQKALMDLLNGQNNPYEFECDMSSWGAEMSSRGLTAGSTLSGKCIPLNLSLAESVAVARFLTFPKNSILFLEDCNEYLYRIIRKIDSLINSGLLENVIAIVLGNFNGCFGADEKPLERNILLDVFARKTNLNVYDLPIFGHDKGRFPLVMGGDVQIFHFGQASKITITNQQEKPQIVATSFPIDLFCKPLDPSKTIHMTGIGGTGMAQVAGLLIANGYKVTGSDNPIYPPMDKLIADLGITPDVGFLAENIKKQTPQSIILANVVSRLSASLKKNDELEEILRTNIPLFSFPSALRKHFLSSSQNIVVSGTHGKTTTSSLIAFLFNSLSLNPSYLIGGSPVNFKSGFALGSKELFVLEGDEYDSAFFDKGPKFLHYEPKIALINNIEFDHADIYENIEAIEQEFLRLAKLCRDRNGIVVANLDDKRVARVVKESDACVIGFSADKKEKHLFACWVLLGFKTTSSGIHVNMKAPNGREFEFKTSVFGAHNALNCVAAFATLHAYQIQKKNDENDLSFLDQTLKSISDFRGVKRRFELLCEKNNITVFDDFAHHPTAIATTLQAFRDYMTSSQKTGRLIVCFDPRNATMRRNVLQDDLSKSFFAADIILLGKVPQDLRMDQTQALNGFEVAKACGTNARYFDDNDILFETLKKEVMSGDTVVFMSSGSFDGISHKFAKSL